LTDTPRISPVEEPDAEQRELLEKTLIGPDGRALNIFATLAHHPRLLKRVNALGGLFMAHGSLSARERELVILRAAFRAGSEYEWAQHVVIGRKAGLTDAEIERVRDVEGDGAWTDSERTLLHVADELHADGDLSDATWSALLESHTPEQALELIVMIGFYAMLAGYLRSVRVQVEPWLKEKTGV
jgi:4-carboxymuconolactone decarboxylase